METKKELTYKENPKLFKIILEAFEFGPGEVAPPLNYFYDSEGNSILIKDHYTIQTMANIIQKHYFTSGKIFGRELIRQEFKNLFNL